MKRLASLIALILSAGLVSASAAQLELHIQANGLVRFDSGPELNNLKLRRQIRVLMKRTPPPEIRILADRTAKYEEVAKVLAAFQRERYGAGVGFYGISQ